MIHVAILYNHNIYKQDSIIPLSSLATSIVQVDILQASEGKATAMDKSGIDDISQAESSSNNQKKVEKSITGKNKTEDLKKNSSLKTAKKGNYGYEKNDNFVSGYASYIPDTIYPLSSRRNKEEGSVIFKINIDSTGKLIDYYIVSSSGYKRLDKEAEKSIKSAKFQPAIKDNNPVESNIELKITFTLTGT